jgi:hypothetical protein
MSRQDPAPPSRQRFAGPEPGKEKTMTTKDTEDRETPEAVAPEDSDELLDEALEESFPASDPPAADHFD